MRHQTRKQIRVARDQAQAELSALKTPEGLATFLFSKKDDEAFGEAFQDQMEKLEDAARDALPDADFEEEEPEVKPEAKPEAKPEPKTPEQNTSTTP